MNPMFKTIQSFFRPVGLFLNWATLPYQEDPLTGRKIRFTQKRGIPFNTTLSDNVQWVLKAGTYTGVILQCWNIYYRVRLDVTDMLAIIVDIDKKTDDIEIL